MLVKSGEKVTHRGVTLSLPLGLRRPHLTGRQNHLPDCDTILTSLRVSPLSIDLPPLYASNGMFHSDFSKILTELFQAALAPTVK